LPGVVRTRVGYTGGHKANPTYHSLGNHTESLQIDYDPRQISYEQLLELFWDNHNPTRQAWSSQYKAALFVHNAQQAEVAEASKAQIAQEKTGRFFGRTVHTEILPAEIFYNAEDYHQKYLLQHTPRVWGDILEIYHTPADWINSTAAARLNGYVGGHGSVAQLEAEIEKLGLSSKAQDHLWQTVRRFER
jgi:peptide-methionine (S)-S-oxide reductase